MYNMICVNITHSDYDYRRLYVHTYIESTILQYLVVVNTIIHSQ